MNIKDKIKFILKSPISYIYSKKYNRPNVMTDVDTLDYIIKNKCSIARYGDGELNLMCGVGIKFQHADVKLKSRLIEIANTQNSKCLTCIPDIFKSQYSVSDRMQKDDANWWKKHLLFARGIWHKFFRADYYGDSLITRFYIELKNKERTEHYVERLRMLWNNENITFVEGDKSKLGVGNNLFDNVLSYNRILCPAQNAFEKYDEILDTINTIVPKENLIICALGPTATVLCYDLSLLGYRALDLGHIDIEYEWYLMGAQSKVNIVGKASGEVKSDFVDGNCDATHIVARIH